MNTNRNDSLWVKHRDKGIRFREHLMAHLRKRDPHAHIPDVYFAHRCYSLTGRTIPAYHTLMRKCGFVIVRLGIHTVCWMWVTKKFLDKHRGYDIIKARWLTDTVILAEEDRDAEEPDPRPDEEDQGDGPTQYVYHRPRCVQDERSGVLPEETVVQSYGYRGDGAVRLNNDSDGGSGDLVTREIAAIAWWSEGHQDLLRRARDFYNTQWRAR